MHGSPKTSRIAAYVIDDCLHGLDEEVLVDPEIDFLADLLAREHARLAQRLQVMRYRGAAQGRYLHDLAYVQALPPLEREQDALAMLVAERRIDLGDLAPGPGYSPHVVSVHITTSLVI